VLLLICRLVLAAVLVVAGVAKLVDLAGSRHAAAEFGVPERWAGVFGLVVPVIELLTGVALLPSFSARFGGAVAAALFVVFSVAIARALARGEAPDCHCFGQLHSEPARPRTVARNVVLLAVAIFVAAAGWEHAGLSATHWVVTIPAAWFVAGSAIVVTAGLVIFQLWFSIELLGQNGRVLARLQALEDGLAQLGDGSASQTGDLMQQRAVGRDSRAGGLAVGAPAPEFRLASLQGEMVTLSSLHAPARRVMLIFVASGCGPCTALMPEIAGWQQSHTERLKLALIAAGDPGRLREEAAPFGLSGVLLDLDRVVAKSYLAAGTPGAVIIDPNGRIASPLVDGAQAIRTLLEQVTDPRLPLLPPAPTLRTYRERGPVPIAAINIGDRPPALRSRLGERAPGVLLSHLDGERVALQDLLQKRTLVIFWNPGCTFCQRMLEDLRALGRDPRERSPGLVVISSGERESIRAQNIGSTVLLDPAGDAMRAFEAGGTPTGLLVENGRIASPVAAGADAILELARLWTVPDGPRDRRRLHSVWLRPHSEHAAGVPANHKVPKKRRSE
jgi:peroxiredoxin